MFRAGPKDDPPRAHAEDHKAELLGAYVERGRDQVIGLLRVPGSPGCWEAGDPVPTTQPSGGRRIFPRWCHCRRRAWPNRLGRPAPRRALHSIAQYPVWAARSPGLTEFIDVDHRRQRRGRPEQNSGLPS